ncbi:MAG: bifunctional heptose 7-phosphate kinase/heptose 1-phosphate adenyltransferase [Planctomycetaceae bacterium]
MSYHLVELVQQLGEPKILVLGDVILDRYVWGDAERISQEAPVILLREDRQEVRLGGAANVANMLRGLEAHATIASVTGSDADAATLREELDAAGVDCSLLVEDAARPTTVKLRYIGRAQHRHPHQILRVDREVRTPISAEVVDRLWAAIEPRLGEFGCILISDYAKGVCTPALMQRLIAAAKQRGVPVIVDPASTGDCTACQGATAITPNRLETGRAAGFDIRTEADAFSAGRALVRKHDLDYVFVTLDSDGIAVVRKDGTAARLPTRKRQVYDITGAGDTVLAMIGVGVAAGVGPEDLARLANLAGGLEVEKIGCVPVTRDEILADLLAHHRGGEGDKIIGNLDELARHVEARRRIGQKIVFTNGCFDLLHPGHVACLQQAAREGDCLVVAVNSDESIRGLNKGPDRPIVPENQRAAMLAALEVVDYTIIFAEATPHRLLERLCPDVLCKGGTYAKQDIVGWEIVEAYGGVAKPLGVVPGLSTTNLVQSIRAEAIARLRKAS